MNINEKLFDFIENSPSAYHTVSSIKAALLDNGYVELSEGECWNLLPGGKYFTSRNGTSVIAFRNPQNKAGFMICASHSDSPAFRLKLTPDSSGAYTSLETERYGGMIMYSWLDRPLSLAGRVVVRTSSGTDIKLVNVDSDAAVIPSIAIHMNRGVNDGYKFNPAKDMMALVGSDKAKGSVMSIIADKLSVNADDIISHDLFLYNRERGRVIGINNEYILSPRLDDLECAFASLEAFINADASDAVPVLAVFDNEEVGSETKQGAASTFLSDVLHRIAGSEAEYSKMLYSGFMVSADNAHAKHPNAPELSDRSNAPLMNGGVVVKFNANQRYATDGVSDAVFSEICRRAGVKTQRFYSRADMPCGSTLGSISNTVVSIPTVDIGLAQLAMHSASETAGAEDVAHMISALTAFYSSSISRTESGITIKSK